jgi:hypothetical protein
MTCILRMLFGRKSALPPQWSNEDLHGGSCARALATRDGEEGYVFILTAAVVKKETEAANAALRKICEDACRTQADLAVRGDALYSKLGRKSLEVKASEQADLMRQFHAME